MPDLIQTPEKKKDNNKTAWSVWLNSERWGFCWNQIELSKQNRKNYLVWKSLDRFPSDFFPKKWLISVTNVRSDSMTQLYNSELNHTVGATNLKEMALWQDITIISVINVCKGMQISVGQRFGTDCKLARECRICTLPASVAISSKADLNRRRRRRRRRWLSRPRKNSSGQPWITTHWNRFGKTPLGWILQSIQTIFLFIIQAYLAGLIEKNKLYVCSGSVREV